MKNTGKEYELFVRDVQQILLNMEGRETITVEQNKILHDRMGNKGNSMFIGNLELADIYIKMLSNAKIIHHLFPLIKLMLLFLKS